MSDFFIILFLAVFLWFVIGLIAPKAAFFWKTDKPKTRGRVLGYGGLSLVVLFFAIGAVTGGGETDSKPAATATQSTQPENKPAPEFENGRLPSNFSMRKDEPGDELEDEPERPRELSPEQKYRHWRRSISTSEMDDSRTVTLITTSTNTVEGRYGRSYRPRLIVRCRENTTALYINWEQYISTQDQYMRYRVGEQPPRQRTFGISTNHESTGLWRGGSSISFIRQLFGEDRLLVEVTPYGENTIRAEFNIRGLDEMIPPLREACNW